MRKTILGAPAFMITGVLALVGCNAHMASDAGILLMPLIGASVFKAIGVNPWIGIIVGYSTANAGFASGFALAGTDALLSGITQSAAEGMGVSGPTHPMINYYFSFVSVITLTLATVFVTEKFMKKHLGEVALERDENELQKHKLTDDENRGLFFALVTFVLYAAAVLYLTVPQNSLFRAPDGTLVPRSPLLSGIMMLLFLFFSLEGIAYGVGARVIKSFNDVPKLMGDGLRGSVGFMVVVLPAAIFVEMFNASRLGVILSVHGANWLKSLDVGTSTILIVFVVVVIFLDLLVVSGSAKWLILAPIFVPMLAQLGMPPALVQMAYRVGDSVINPMSPISPYMPVILGLMDQYRPTGQTKDAGIGTLLSLCLPYSAIYIVVLLLQLVIWYSLGLPLGPGVPVSM
jgi:aminobenzoyl-glutamate transport protein